MNGSSLAPGFPEKEDRHTFSLVGSFASEGASQEWKRLLRSSLDDVVGIALRLGIDPDEISDVMARYPARINPYYLSLIREHGDPIWRQCIPSREEIDDDFGDEDPLYEEPENQARQGVPELITHRYPDRALLRISNQCAMYCRFCTRKRKVGDDDLQPTPNEIDEAIAYLCEHPEIRDVILSGGDPLMLDDRPLERILERVFAVMSEREYGILRLGTRMPVVLPQRITPELVGMLRNYQPLYVNTHFNHPREITDESRRACGMLVDAGIPVGNQTVLLEGVNDDPVVMKELMQGLVHMRVRPYYIYQCDPVLGANHFRTRVEKALEIYRSLRGHTSGLCVPTLVIDAPGGGGKIPILPDYLVSIDDEKVVLRNYEGKTHVYPQRKLPAPAPFTPRTA